MPAINQVFDLREPFMNIKQRKWIFILGLLVISTTLISTQFRTNGQIESGGRTRKYLLYVPESYQPETQAPLVISIHGFVQWPAHQAYLSGWNKLADEYGFLVVYPQGTGFPLRWATRPQEGDPAAMAAEIQFLADLIDQLNRTYSIDPSRIYANGMSNGGGMSEVLACELSDTIAAFGGVAGAYLFPWQDCHPSHPVPVILFHGIADPVVPYIGGLSSRDRQFEFPPVEHRLANWAEINSCPNSPEISAVTAQIKRYYFGDCEGAAEVMLYSLEDGGHTWPGGEKIPIWIAGYTSPDIQATAIMWDFFSQYSLEGQ